MVNLPAARIDSDIDPASDAAPVPRQSGNPFDLSDDVAYGRWRARKLADTALPAEVLWVDLKDTGSPDATEREQLRERCQRFNMALYRGPADAGRDQVTALGASLGLRHLDDHLCVDEDLITSLQVRDSGLHRGYIPYSNKGLQWHTDGYYNPPHQQVRSVLLHCVRPAAEGGENALLDADLIYIALRDQDPALIVALQHPQAMTIPANIDAGREIRPEQSGPVFSLDPRSGDLHTRYTARKRSIAWRDEADTRRAVAAIEAFLQSGNAPVRSVKLAAGEGLVSNNVLHNRRRFRDHHDPANTRLLYRARYYQRVATTAGNVSPAVEK